MWGKIMTNLEYIELLEYISKRSNELESVNIYAVHSTFNPKTNQINKVTLKLNYTKDGSPLPDINGKLTKRMVKNVVSRIEHFRGDSCNKDNIKKWIDLLMEVKEGQL